MPSSGAKRQYAENQSLWSLWHRKGKGKDQRRLWMAAGVFADGSVLRIADMRRRLVEGGVADTAETGELKRAVG